MSDLKRLTFVHIPKSGGNSLLQALKSQFDENEVSPFIFEGKTEINGSAGYKLIAGHIGFSVAETFDAPIVTVLREPVDRVISLYYYWRSHNAGPKILQDMTLEEFVESDHPGINTSVDNAQTWQIAHGLVPREQRQLRLSEGALLGRAIRNIGKCAVVDITERLGEFSVRLSTILEMRLPQLERVNTTPRRPPTKDVTAEVRTKIESRTKLDRLLYQYVVAYIG